VGGRCRGGAHGRRRRIRGAGEARALDDVGAGEDRGLQRAISACIIVVDPAELELQCQRKGGADTEPTLYPARPGAQRARRLVRRLLTVIVSATWPALGTTAAVLVTEPGAIAKARALLKDELEQIDAACSRFAVTIAGELTHRRVWSGTGHTLSTPASGSRMMPLTNDDIAEFGFPGRMATVGRRHEMPSTKPRRE